MLILKTKKNENNKIQNFIGLSPSLALIYIMNFTIKLNKAQQFCPLEYKTLLAWKCKKEH